MEKKYSKKYFLKRDTLILHLAQTIATFAKKNKVRSILDVGCGTGLLVKFLNTNHFEASGCDNSENAIKMAKKTNGQKKIILATATNLPFKANKFDLVTSISVIEHLNNNNAIKFIQESRRVLRKNGFIFLVTPNFATPLRILSGTKWFAYQDKTHIDFFTPKSLSAILVKNGFKNPQTLFPVKYQKSLDFEFPVMLRKLPPVVKRILVHLIYATPFAVVRNSFWISAQKND